MVEIVTNEREWVENKLASPSLGKKPMETLGRIARYTYNAGYTKKNEIARKLEEYLLRCDPSVSLVKWQDAIMAAAKSAERYPMIDVRGVDVTQNELEEIKKITGVMARKVMFTLVCLAKYSNAVNPLNKNWVNFSTKDIFSLANVNVSNKRRALIINDLWNAGYVGYSHIIDNTNLNVKMLEADGTPALHIEDFRDLGNQYLMHMGENYMICQSCGAIVKRQSSAQKYCRLCAPQINTEKTMMNRRRKNAKVENV